MRFPRSGSTRAINSAAPIHAKYIKSFVVDFDADRVWVVFDWDEVGFRKFVSDPEVPAILKEAGHVGKPQAAPLGGRYGA